MDRLATFALLAAGMALFGSATPISKVVGEVFPPILASALRMLTAVVVLLPLYVRQRRRADEPILPDVDTGDRWRLAGIAVIGTFGFTVLLLLGLQRVPGAVGALVMATAPVVTALGAVAFLDESFDRRLGIALALAFTGAAVANLGRSGDGSGGDGGAVLLLGAALVLGAVACEATYSLLGKQLTADLSPLAITTIAAAAAGLLFAPIAAVQAVGFDWTSPSTGDWLAIGFWGAGTMGLGSVLWFRGMSRTEGSTAAAFMAVMPVSALLGAYVLLGESPQWIHAVGIGAAVAAIAVVSRR